MAIVFQSDAIAVANATTVVVTKPSGTIDGDVLVTFWFVRANEVDANLTLPTGWTQAFVDDGQNPTIKIAYRVASSEPTNYTFTVTSTARQMAAWVGRFTGVDTTTVSDATASSQPVSSSSSVTIPSITTATNGAWVLCFLGSPNGSLYDPTAPSGFTDMRDYIGASIANINASYMEQASAGATGSKVGTWANAVTVGIGAMWAIKPASVATASLVMRKRASALVRM